ncbi:MAG: VanW family protein [Enterococcus sp.]|nr:VanW family protein [Enterococcus sp.]
MIEPEIQDGVLLPSLNDKQISPFIIFQLSKNNINVDINVSMENNDNKITVKLEKKENFPNTNKLIYDLEENLFFVNGKKELNTLPIQNMPEAQLELASLPDTLSFEDALKAGVISQISTYSTAYSAGTGQINRNINIELSAKTINNTICKSSDPYWSFLSYVGETTPEKGYKPASVVSGGKIEQDYGGGVCQVATTVFLSAFYAGFPIPTRFNHNLYMSTYPDGKDAAIAYPDQDLVWTNDTGSDVLLKTQCDGSSVTVSLYGVNPFRTVKDYVVSQKEGSDYITLYEIDNKLKPSQSYVKTSGLNGKTIVIRREVYDSTGNLVRNDTFTSNYSPKTEIIICGSQETANKLKSEKKQ